MCDVTLRDERTNWIYRFFLEEKPYEGTHKLQRGVGGEGMMYHVLNGISTFPSNGENGGIAFRALWRENRCNCKT